MTCIFNRRDGDTHHPVGNVVSVRSHLGIHGDKIPPEGFALQPLPQGFPIGNVTDVNPWVLQREGEERVGDLLSHCPAWMWAWQSYLHPERRSCCRILGKLQQRWCFWVGLTHTILPLRTINTPLSCIQMRMKAFFLINLFFRLNAQSCWPLSQ